MNTYGEIVEFIMRHRSGAAFPDATPENIIPELDKQIRNGTLAFSCDDTGHINGVMFGEVRGDEFYVQNILTTSKAIAKRFMCWIVTQHSDTCKWITGNRHGKRMCRHEIKPSNFKYIYG